MPAIRLFCVAASHPVLSVELMLRHKQLSYRKSELPIGWSGLMLRARGFEQRTVPALVVDGQRIQGSRTIARRLEEIRPEPSLFPADPRERGAVEAAEEFGEQLQDVVRRIELWAVSRRPEAARAQLADSRLPIPASIAVALTPWTVRYLRRAHRATDAAVRRDLEELPSMLNRVDALIERGVLGREPPTAADFQLAPTLALLLETEDLRPLVEGRPAHELARRLVPRFPAHIPAGVIPAPARDTGAAVREAAP